MGARERFAAARVAAREGRHQEALDGLLWFHHHALEEQPSLRGVRMSYALYEWLDLGRVYPPARQALEEVRAQTAQALLRGDGDDSLFHELVAIDEALAQGHATYAVYVALLEHQPELAARCMPLALPVIVAAGDYPLADRVRQDPRTRVQEAIELMHFERRWIKRRKPNHLQLRWNRIRHYAQAVQLDATISARMGRHDEARRLVAYALDLIDDPSLRAAVRMQLAKRSTLMPGEARDMHHRAKAQRREARHQAARPPT
jgi:hypothetical protein